MDPCTQDERIERIERNVDQLSQDVKQISADVCELTGIVKENLIKRLDDHDHVLNGYQNEPGLIFSSQEQTKVTKDLVKTLRGEGQDNGLIGAVTEAVKVINKLSDDQKWLSRLVIGAVIATVLGLVLMP